jgi:DNA-binding CsgD family transcriptional regulator
MVGREPELQAMVAAVAAARAGQPTLLLVEGEPGIGKTRLLAEAIDRCSTDDDILLVGHGVDFVGGELPFGVIASALRDLVRRQGPDVVRDIAAEDARALASIVPELDPARERPDRLRVFTATATLLSRLCTDRLTWLVIEDVHWADNASLDLLGYVIRVTDHPGKLLITITVRTGNSPASGPLARFTNELARLRHAQTLLLQPLSRASLEEALSDLLREAPSARLLDRVFRLSGGVPFVTEELVAGGLEAGTHVPQSLAAMMRMRVSSLSPGAQQVIATAALSGNNIPHLLMEQVCDLPRHAFEAGMKEAIDTGILEIDAAGTGYQFHHALMREAVAEAMAPAARMIGHRRWAETIENQPDAQRDPLAVIATAHHWAATDDRERAFAAALCAADAAATIGAEGERAGLLTIVLELLPVVSAAVKKGTDPDEILQDALTAHERADQPAEALALIDSRLREAPDDEDEARQLLLRLTRARYALRLGLTPDPILADQEASRAILSKVPDGRAFVRAVASLYEVGLRRELAADQLLDRATAVADRIGRPLDRLAVRRARMEQLGGLGHHDEAAAFSLELLPWVQQNFTLTEICSWESSTAAWLCCLGRYDEAVQLGRSTLRRLKDPLLAPGAWAFCTEQLTYALTETGAWDEAAELLHVGRRLGVRAQGTVFMDATAGMIYAFRGELDESAACLALARDRYSDLKHTMPGAHLWTQCLAAELSLARGEPAAARAHLEPILDNPQFRADGELWRLVLVAARTEVEVPQRSAKRRPEDSQASRERLDRLLRVADSIAADSLAGAAFLAQLDALNARLEESDTPAAWEKAIESWAATGQTHDRAWALIGLAESHLRARDKDAAGTALAEALEIGDTLRAQPLLEAVRETAGRGGILHAETSWTHPPSSYGLTPRELEVMRAVAQGYSNAQIAQGLFISAKTASVHVSRILTKLGATNRTQAVAIARKEGLINL